MELDRCRDLRDHYADYAAGTLDHPEELRVRLHLGEGCAACAVEIEQLMEAFHAVPLGGTPAALPPGSRERLLEEVQRSEQEQHEVPITYPETDPARLWKVLAGLAAVAVVAVAFWGSGKVETAGALQSDVDAARRANAVEVRSLERQLEQARTTLRGMGAPGARVVDLDGSVRARAFIDPDGGTVTFSSEPLGAPPENTLHHAWLVGESPALLGALAPGWSEHGGQIVLRLTGDDAGEVLVTTEPTGSKPESPTGPVVLRGAAAK